MPLKTYFVDHINNLRYPLNGVKPSDKDAPQPAAGKLFRNHMVLKASELPPKVDLRPAMTSIEQQSTANSCVANALAGAYEYLLNRATGTQIDVSRLFMYFNARYRANPSGMVTDTGCLINHAIAALSEYGTCLETLWPYEVSHVNMQPSAQCYQSAKDHRIVDWLHVGVNLEEMKMCLAQGYPITFGAELFDSFGYATQTGRVPMPSAAELDPSRFYDPTRQQKQHRYHAMLAVGYSDLSQVFVVRNSWGEQWGEQGYCYFPYAYLSNPNLVFDAWAVRRLATDDFSRDGWSFQDTVNYGEGSTPRVLHATHEPAKWEIVDVEESGEHKEVAKETSTSTSQSETEAPAAKDETEVPAAKDETETPAAEGETETPAAKDETEAPATKDETEAPAAEGEIEAPAAQGET